MGFFDDVWDGTKKFASKIGKAIDWTDDKIAKPLDKLSGIGEKIACALGPESIACDVAQGVNDGTQLFHKAREINDKIDGAFKIDHNYKGDPNFMKKKKRRKKKERSDPSPPPTRTSSPKTRRKGRHHRDVEDTDDRDKRKVLVSIMKKLKVRDLDALADFKPKTKKERRLHSKAKILVRDLN